MKPKTKQALVSIFSLITLVLLLWGIFWSIRWFWRYLTALNPELAVGLLTASATILVATLTVALGRWFERKKEVEAHFREKKSAIYDSFLKEFFRLYHSEGAPNPDIVSFLREWQRQMILWGGAGLLTSYFKWMQNLKLGRPDADSLFLMHDFFCALRRDLGLSNRGLERGAFVRIILQQGDLFLDMAKENPRVTLEELAAKEKELGLPKP